MLATASVITNISSTSSNTDPDLWRRRIKREMADLYPLYHEMLKGAEPCEEHYQRLKEARECVQNRLDGKPLTSGFKWKALDHFTVTSVVVDREGREVFYFAGEPKNRFVVRLAFRSQCAAYLTFPIDQIARVFGWSPAVFQEKMPQLDGGLIRSYLCDDRPVYLFSEWHNRKLYRAARNKLISAGIEGTIACFLEGCPRLPEAEDNYRIQLICNAKANYATSKNVVPVSQGNIHFARTPIQYTEATLGPVIRPNAVYGLEHSGYFVLTHCLGGLFEHKENRVDSIKMCCWHLQWTTEGKKIWHEVTKGLSADECRLLEEAGETIGELDPALYQAIAKLNLKPLFAKLGCLVIEQYPGIGLTPEEKGGLSLFLTQPDAALYDRWYHLIQDKRDLFFAYNMRSVCKTLPKKLSAAAVIGSLHLHGTLAQLCAQSEELSKVPLQRLESHYRKVAPLAERMKISHQLHPAVTHTSSNFWEELQLAMRLTHLNSPLASSGILNRKGLAHYLCGFAEMQYDPASLTPIEYVLLANAFVEAKWEKDQRKSIEAFFCTLAPHILKQLSAFKKIRHRALLAKAYGMIELKGDARKPVDALLSALARDGDSPNLWAPSKYALGVTVLAITVLAYLAHALLLSTGSVKSE